MISLRSSVTAFQWSSSEQVYPFEKTVNGDTLYAIRVDMGALLNTAGKTVAHNIPGGLIASKIHRLWGYASHPSGFALPLPHVSGNLAEMIALVFTNTDAIVVSYQNKTDYTGPNFVFIIYSK